MPTQPKITKGKYGGTISDFGYGQAYSDPRDNPNYQPPAPVKSVYNVNGTKVRATSQGAADELAEEVVTSRTKRTPRVTVADDSGDDFEDVGTFDEYQDKAGLSGKERNAITSQYTGLAQSMTDAINKEFASKYARVDDTIKGEMARTKVLNQKSGNIDSGTGSTAIGETKRKGDEALNAIDELKSARIQQALGKVKQIETEALERAIDQKASNLSAYNTERVATLKRNKDRADSIISDLASSGVDLEALKEDSEDGKSNTYEKLLKASGLPEIAFESNYNAKKDLANKVTYTYRNLGNGVTLRTGVKANGGAVPEKEFRFSAPDGYNIVQTTDGELLFKNQKTGEILPANTVAVGKSPTAPKAGTVPTKQAAIVKEENDALNWIARQPGYDPKEKEEFKNNDAFRAWAIQQAKLEGKKTTTTSTKTGP